MRRFDNQRISKLHREVHPTSSCGGRVTSGKDLFNTDYWCVYCGAKWNE